MSPTKLRRRLQQVRVLAREGATEGERQAARAAIARLEARLRERPVALDDALEPGRQDAVPGIRDLDRILRAWMDGDLSASQLARASQGMVDRVVLPDRPPSDPVSIRVEVVMLLTTLPDGPISVVDAPALRAFLAGCEGDCRQAWRSWFAHLEAREGVASFGA